MQTRILGRSGLLVSEVGLGCRWLVTQGKKAIPDAMARETVRTALRLGITHFDTAPGYADSESVLGDVLAEAGTACVVSTKVWSSDESAIRRSLDNSLTVLGRSVLDIYLIHNPEDSLKMLPLFRKLRDEKLIRAVGVCAWHGEEELLKTVLAEGIADIIQIAATLTHHGMLTHGIVDEAVRGNIGIQIMSPLAKGILSGSHPVLAPLLPYGITTLEQASLKFLLDHIPNGAVLPGTSKPGRLHAFASVSGLPLVPEMVWQQVLEEIGRFPALMELP